VLLIVTDGVSRGNFRRLRWREPEPIWKRKSKREDKNGTRLAVVRREGSYLRGFGLWVIMKVSVGKGWDGDCFGICVHRQTQCVVWRGRSVTSHHINVVMLPRSLISKRRRSFSATIIAREEVQQTNSLIVSGYYSFLVSVVWHSWHSAERRSLFQSFLPVCMRVTTPKPQKGFSLSFILENLTTRTCALSVFSKFRHCKYHFI
jgi:hypothetical protein